MSIAGCSFALDLPALYREASTPWSSEQAVMVPAALTPETLAVIGKNYGPSAAKVLAEKKEKVSALLIRFRACDLEAEDVQTAEKYLEKRFKAEVAYFAGSGCKAVKVSDGPAAPAGPALVKLERFFAPGGSAVFEKGGVLFDGDTERRRQMAPVLASASMPPVPDEAPAQRNPFSAVPARPAVVPGLSASGAAGRPAPPMPPIEENGRVNRAVVFWNDVRAQSEFSLKNDGSTVPEKARAAARLAAGAAFGGLLWYSNLSIVEQAAARLGWDHGLGAGGKTIAQDAAKLAFHSARFANTLLPLSTFRLLRGAIRASNMAVRIKAMALLAGRAGLAIGGYAERYFYPEGPGDAGPGQTSLNEPDRK